MCPYIFFKLESVTWEKNVHLTMNIFFGVIFGFFKKIVATRKAHDLSPADEENDNILRGCQLTFIVPVWKKESASIHTWKLCFVSRKAYHLVEPQKKKDNLHVIMLTPRITLFKNFFSCGAPFSSTKIHKQPKKGLSFFMMMISV